jgi:hypothetical protein
VFRYQQRLNNGATYPHLGWHSEVQVMKGGGQGGGRRDKVVLCKSKHHSIRGLFEKYPASTMMDGQLTTSVVVVKDPLTWLLSLCKETYVYRVLRNATLRELKAHRRNNSNVEVIEDRYVARPTSECAAEDSVLEWVGNGYSGETAFSIGVDPYTRKGHAAEVWGDFITGFLDAKLPSNAHRVVIRWEDALYGHNFAQLHFFSFYLKALDNPNFLSRSYHTKEWTSSMCGCFGHPVSPGEVIEVEDSVKSDHNTVTLPNGTKVTWRH